MSICAGCGYSFRKGKRRAILQPSGEVVTRLVCADCARRAFAVVPVRRTSLCSACPSDDMREATLCNRCSNDQAHRAVTVALAPFVERLQGFYALAKLEGHTEKANGLELAIDILLSQKVQ